MRRSAPIAFWIFATLLGAEIGSAVLGPVLIPKTAYLHTYLSGQALRSTQLFLKGEGVLLPDSAAGWTNRPNVAIETWVIDSLGSRSVRPATWQRREPIRVLAIGSSTTNGGTGVTNQQTITAYLESPGVEALNFGTMLYAPDQDYLAWRSRLYRFAPDVIVVGLDADPAGSMPSVYVPLHIPSEVNIPFVKPRFVLHGDSLVLVSQPPERLLADVPDNPLLIDFFERNDGYAWVFSSYCRLGLTPIDGGLRAVWMRLQRRLETTHPPAPSADLIAAVLRRFQSEAIAAGSRIVFLHFPSRSFMSRGWRGLAPDTYAEWQAALAARGVTVIDVRSILRESHEPLGNLFMRDGNHFTATANRLIALGIRGAVLGGAKSAAGVAAASDPARDAGDGPAAGDPGAP